MRSRANSLKVGTGNNRELVSRAMPIGRPRGMRLSPDLRSARFRRLSTCAAMLIGVWGLEAPAASCVLTAVAAALDAVSKA